MLNNIKLFLNYASAGIKIESEKYVKLSTSIDNTHFVLKKQMKKEFYKTPKVFVALKFNLN
jgi:hypothetical protein